MLIAFRDAERSFKEKPLESFGQWCVFSDQILQLRLQNDTNFPTPHIFISPSGLVQFSHIGVGVITATSDTEVPIEESGAPLGDQFVPLLGTIRKAFQNRRKPSSLGSALIETIRIRQQPIGEHPAAARRWRRVGG